MSKIVVLDPGHGPVSNPYPAAPGFYEGTQMFKLCGYLKECLEANGIKVITTRKDISENPALEVRGKTAGTNKADLFISLHSDAAGNGGIYSARGMSVYYSITNAESNKVFAQNLSNAVSKVLNTSIRGPFTRLLDDGRDYYGVIRASAGSGCRNAFLIEHGFHTSTEDVKALITDDSLKQIAKTECKVICDYLKLDCSTESVTLTNPIKQPEETTNEVVKTNTTLLKYTNAANAIAGDKTLSVGTLAPGTYYIYKTYGTATNLTKTPGVAGAWVVISDNVVDKNPSENEISKVEAPQETIHIDVNMKIYANAFDAASKSNFITVGGSPKYYQPGTYYVYKKENAIVMNISTKSDTAGAWINTSEAKPEVSDFNVGDTVAFIWGTTPVYVDNTKIPLTVIAAVNGPKNSIVTELCGSNVKISNISTPIPKKYLYVVNKATPDSVEIAETLNQFTEEAPATTDKTEVTSDDIAKILEDKFGSLSDLAKTKGYEDFVKYMENLVYDDTTLNTEVGLESIMGSSVLTANQLTTYIRKNNPDFDGNIASAFIKLGAIYGIRGDVACCQSILETGWFKFVGSSVKPAQHNYCGLGATGGGVAGCVFPTIEQGVEAQMQHLYAYACTADIPAGRTMYDPRFKYVTRGCAPRWVDLNLKWCTGADYGEKILSIYKQIANS